MDSMEWRVDSIEWLMDSMDWLMDSMDWLMDSMDFPDGFHIIPWNFQMDSILFKSDLMPPQNSIQNSYVNIDLVLIIST